MFENANNTSLSGFTKAELLDKLNANASISNLDTIENGGGPISFSQIHWNNNIHFDLAYHPWKHLGFKIAVATLSQNLVKGSAPEYLTMSISTSSMYSLDALEELMQGFFAASIKYGCKARLSEITTCVSGLHLSATAISTNLPVKMPFINKTITAGDLICTSGDLGAGYLGLMLLEREKRIFKEHPEMQPDLEGKDYIVGRQLKPELRVDILELIASNQLDISKSTNLDFGLTHALQTITNKTELGAVIYEDKLPIDTQTLMQCIEFGIDPTVAALNGGEDYEWCFVASQSSYDKIESLKENITVIGYISDQTTDLLINLKSGKSEKIEVLKFQ